MKICVPITSRAAYGRLKSVLREINKRHELQLIVGASAIMDRFGNVKELLEEEFTVFGTFSGTEGCLPKDMAISSSVIITQLVVLFDTLKPDIVLVHADRFETLAVAMTAAYMNIPIAHNQGGEVTGSIDESVRHSVTKLSHIHFTATEKAKENVYKMGEAYGNIHNVGCPSLDLLKDELKRPDVNTQGRGFNIDLDQDFYLVVYHPVTTEQIYKTNELLDKLDSTGKQVIWLYPNIDAGHDLILKTINQFHERNPESRIRFVKNFRPEEYLWLMERCICLIGNTSSGIREGSFLGVPYFLIGNRQIGREISKNVHIGLDTKGDIVDFPSEFFRYPKSELYGSCTSAKQIVDILEDSNIQIQKRLNY